jgi:hypothetical protein
MKGEDTDKVQFWLNNPCNLAKDCSLFPTSTMPVDEKLNSITRLVLVIGVTLWALKYEYWNLFLLGGLLAIIIIKYISESKTVSEGFTIPPTYVDGASPMTTVPPLFAEEWQIPPPAYDVINMQGVNNPYTEVACESQTTLLQKPYPIFSQYITDTTIIPSEEEEFKNRSLQDVKMYATDAYTRDQLQFRNDIIRPFVNRINREYRHGCFDQITPYSSW